MAGLHLLDPETGEYNFPYIRQYLKGIDVKVIHLVYREQGLIVQKGNPKGIEGLERSYSAKRSPLSTARRVRGQESCSITH